MSDEEKKVKEEEVKELSPKKKHLAQLQKLEEQLTAAKAEAKDWENKYLRALADMDNARKNNAKEFEQIYKYRAVGVIEKILPSLDIFSQVLRNEPEDQVLRNYLTGFKYVESQLLESLGSEGLKEVIVSVGDKFDEKTMHALEVEYDPNLPDNTVKQVRNSTYFFHDRLIRPAQVSVSTTKEPVTEEEKDENSPDCDPSTLN